MKRTTLTIQPCDFQVFGVFRNMTGRRFASDGGVLSAVTCILTQLPRGLMSVALLGSLQRETNLSMLGMYKSNNCMDIEARFSF